MGSRSIKSNFQRIGREKQFAGPNSVWLSPPKKSNCIMCSSIFSLLFDGKKFRQRLISWKPPRQQGFLSISKNFVFLPYISKTSASEEILTLPHEKNGEKNWSQLTKQKWPCLVLCQKKLIQYYTKIVIRYDNEQNLLCGPIRGTQRNSNSSRHGNISLFDIWDLF